MSVQLFSGKLIFGSILLANAGLGAVYRSIAPKFTLLSKIPLKPQMKAFALATVVQGIFMSRYPPQKNEGFSKRKAFEVLAPYLLISGSIYFQHRQAFKANIMSSAVLGTVQLAVSPLSTKMIDNQASTVPEDTVLGTVQLAVSPLSTKMIDNQASTVPEDTVLGTVQLAVSPLSTKMIDNQASTVPEDAVLGTVQLAVSPLSTKMIDNQASTAPKDFVPEDMAFGKNNWSQYFGEVGEVPAFPEDISEILKASCPFIRGKQVRDTHTLVLIPQTVDGRPFTLNLLEELIKKPREKNKSKFSYYNKSVKTELGEKKVEKSYWVLMTKDVIPESRYKTYEEQKQLVQEKGLGHYEIPSTIEAAASIFMHFFQTDEVLYGSGISTRCQEKVLDGQCSTSIGSSSRERLIVTHDAFGGSFSYGSGNRGAAAVRKF